MSAKEGNAIFAKNGGLLENVAQVPKEEAVGEKKKPGALFSVFSKNNEKSKITLKSANRTPVDTTTVGSTQSLEPVAQDSQTDELFNESAACRYLRASSDLEATIIGSPSLSASSDDDGSGSVSIGLNLLDLRKARLVRATGDARCRIQTASREIEATLGLGAEATKYAAAHAKQSHIRNNLGQLNAIKSKANQLVTSGIITQQDANLIGLKINQIKSQMEIAKSEAEKRQSLPELDINSLRNRHGALVDATNELQDIERNIRTNDAVELRVSTGYRYNDEFNNDLQNTDNDGAFARVNLGIRLGAFTERRRQLEEEAASARIDALHEENTGTIWKSGFALRAIGRTITNLQKSEKELLSALNQASDTVKRLQSADRPEIIRTKLQTQIEKIAVGSELAAVRATIKQMRDNQTKLRSLSN